ncbi:MAG: hypothetical protein KAR15_20775, partial [Desulfobacterales bacterium]|nr:hypothetical protein [Desulfobacterales bacterium]
VCYPINYAGSVVRYEQRPVVYDDDVHRPSPGFVFFQPAVSKYLITGCIVFVKDGLCNPITDRYTTIPRPVFGNKNLIPSGLMTIDLALGISVA